MNNPLVTVTSKDWQNILAIMDFDKKQGGFVDYNKDGELVFFYLNPMINGNSAFYVTREDVIYYIKKTSHS